MATNDKSIEKIYRIELQGSEAAVEDVLNLEKAFKKLRDTKVALNKELEKSIAGNDSKAVDDLKTKIAALDSEVKKLNQQRTQAQKVATDQAKAEKILADIKLTEAKAEKELAQAEKTRTADLIQQEKEIDRQIDRETKLAAARIKSAAANTAEAGSQRDRLNALKELRPFITGTAAGSDATTNFRGEILTLDQAIERFKDLSIAEQTFRRQFQQDGTLVGEYSRGILDAFKKGGLDNLISGQSDKVKNELSKLDVEFAELKQQLIALGATSGPAFDKIESELISNRKAAQQFEGQLESINTSLKGFGGVGTQITNSLKENFASLKTQATQFAIGFFGFQKVLSEIQQGVAAAKEIEGVEAAFKNLNDPNLLANLRAATRGTVSDLELMKQAVQAENFQIPLDQLGTLLDFARRRAKDTGQEVDYLVQSIITGIGRKSPLILDNLGISAVRLKEKFKGVKEESLEVGDVAKAVGEIIAEENAKAGAEIATTGEKIAQQQAQWQNIRTEIGERLLPVMSALGSLTLFFVGNLPIVATLLGLYAAGWALVNKEMIINRAEMIAQRVLLPVLSVLFGGQANALKAWAAATQVLTAAKTRLLAVLSNPYFKIFGLIIGGIVVALKAYSSQVTSIVAGTDRLAQKQKALNEINAQAARQLAQTRAQEEALLRIIRDRTLADDTRERALARLKGIMGEYGEALTLETVLTNKGTEALKAYNEELERKAKATAAAAIAERENAKLQQLYQAQFDVANAIKNNGNIALSQLTQDLVDKYYDQTGRSASKIGKFLGDKVGIDFTYSGKDLQEFAKVIESEIKKQLDKTAGAELARIEVEGTNKNGIIVAPNFEIDVAKTKAELDELNKAVAEFKGTQADYNKLLADRDAKQKEYDRLTKSATRDRASSLSAQQKDIFKDIEAIAAQQTAAENLRFAELKTNHELTAEEEIQHLNRINDINADAIDKKLALVKGGNAEERKVIATLKLERINAEEQTSAAIDQILKKQFDKEKAALDLRKKLAQDAANEIFQDSVSKPFASEEDKAKAKAELDRSTLAAEVEFNRAMIALEIQYKQQSEANERERVNALIKLRQSLKQDAIDVLEAQLKDLESNLSIDLAAARKVYADLKLGNQQSGLKETKKATNAQSLDRAEATTVLSLEIEKLKKEVVLYDNLLKAGIDVREKYFKAATDLAEKQKQLDESLGKDFEDRWNKNLSVVENLKNRFQEFLRDAFKIKKGSEGDAALGQAIGEAISQAYSLAQSAMSNYFDAERNRIEQSKELQLERLELQKKQALARSQSQAEEESINKQFEQKRKQAEKEAFEKNKAVQVKQAKIALLTEIANIWSSVWKIGNPVAAAALGALFTGLAYVRYSNTVSGINSQKFEHGGQVPTRTGGQSRGRSHADGGIKFNYEAEGDELFVVNKRSAAIPRRYTVSGTPKQIASAINQLGGGVAFSAGASVRRFADGGVIGGMLSAPAFAPASQVGGFDDERLTRLEGIVESVARTVEMTDAKPVIQVTSSVTKAQAREVQQRQIGTL